ncbi:ankyrin repeat domain-containing protein [Candidatus Babela massiliensis]|uniref:Ankyrin repeats containing protein n=1 Tax=Candidatus Babela massiliensis TaxID=673862 RepID=V6DKH2_9BACT|nr:ankyrin repeat domain-containing protein [Candidatus Babela massiliensis]CDK31006.1 Ankyrin repeats containing protein [Candidatus Babela massiliensis]
MKIKYLITLIISIFLNSNINPMEMYQNSYENPNKTLSIKDLPFELIIIFFGFTIQDHFNDQEDIFNITEDNINSHIKSIVFKVTIRATCQKFYNAFKTYQEKYLINELSVYRKKRFVYLIDKIKFNINKINSQEHFNQELIDLKLTTLLDEIDVPKTLSQVIYQDTILNLKSRLKKEVIELIKLGANPNTKDKEGSTTLMQAIYLEDISIIEVLIALGANVNSQNNYNNNALRIASYYNYANIVNLLLAKGADINIKDINNSTALMAAVKLGQYDTVKLLLEQGANVNTQDSNQDTALILAAWCRHNNIGELLLEYKANVNTRDKTGNTPLILATRKSCSGLIKSLLEKGADINAQNDYGDSALIYAYKICPDIVNLLLDKGANINIQNNEGYTPLMYIIINNNLDIFKLLLTRGANILLKNNEGETALDIAKKRHQEILNNIKKSNNQYIVKILLNEINIVIKSIEDQINEINN